MQKSNVNVLCCSVSRRGRDDGERSGDDLFMSRCRFGNILSLMIISDVCCLTMFTFAHRWRDFFWLRAEFFSGRRTFCSNLLKCSWSGNGMQKQKKSKGKSGGAVFGSISYSCCSSLTVLFLFGRFSAERSKIRVVCNTIFLD